MAKAERFLEIDENDLHGEWSRQSPLYLQYADELAEAEGDKLEADAEFELVKAEVASTVRRKPGKFGLGGRPNVAAVKDAMICSEDYQRAQKACIVAQKRVLHLKAAVRSLEHRKAALENKVFLRGQGYYADKPKKRLSDMGGGRRVLDEMQKRAARRSLGRRGHDDD